MGNGKFLIFDVEFLMCKGSCVMRDALWGIGNGEGLFLILNFGCVKGHA
jgi:hypothetical protein